jgi:hypothetical protein
MRKYLLLSLSLALLVAAGCNKKTDPVFSETPDERVNKAMAEFQAKMIGGQYGWIGVLEPKVGTPYNFFFIFKPDNRVVMLSDYSQTTATVQKESSWRLKALQQPTLIFDTYSYIHMLADPNPAVAGGEAGKGYYSDFEFAYDPTLEQEDTIKMTGRFNGAKFTIIRATKEQQDAFLNGELAKAFDFNKISALSTYVYRGAGGDWGVGGEIFNYWKRFTIDGTTYEVDEGTFDPINRSISFSRYNNGVKQTHNTTYKIGAGAIVLTTPFTTPAGTIVSSFTNVTWNDAAKTLTVNVNKSNATTTFAGATAPLYYDTTSFTKFRAEGIANTYWISDYGFQRNGVFNNFGIDTLTARTAAGVNTYYYAIYWPGYGPNFDLFAPVFLNPPQTGLTLVYGYAAINNSVPNPIVKDGIGNFNFGGSVGTGMPSTGGWGGTLSLFRANTGYYFIKLPGGGYDQVAVSDAQSWINWVE